MADELWTTITAALEQIAPPQTAETDLAAGRLLRVLFDGEEFGFELWHRWHSGKLWRVSS